MVAGMANRAKVKLATLPRMADFAIWSAACEPALWPAGTFATFATAFDANRKELIEGVLDADAIASAIRALMATQEEWVGTASELLVALEGVAGERAAKSKNWPSSAEALGRGLRRPATFLRKVGIEISRERDPHSKERTRLIKITRQRLGGRCRLRSGASTTPSSTWWAAVPTIACWLSAIGAMMAARLLISLRSRLVMP